MICPFVRVVRTDELHGGDEFTRGQVQHLKKGVRFLNVLQFDQTKRLKRSPQR